MPKPTMSIDPSTPARPGRTRQGAPAFKERLRHDLAVIDAEGWDGETGRTLLTDLRRQLVRRVLAAETLQGRERAQAEAAAWQKVWQALTTESIRTASNPWTALWTVARRAVHDEIVAARMHTSARKAWGWSEVTSAEEAAAIDGPRAWPTLFSVEAMRHAGIPLPDAGITTTPRGLGERLELIADAMACAGWDHAVARALVLRIAEAAADSDAGNLLLGWKPIARDLGLAAWSVRRVQVLILGHEAWPGLFERIVLDGAHVLAQPDVQAALASTRRHNDPPPEALMDTSETSSRELRTQDLRRAS